MCFELISKTMLDSLACAALAFAFLHSPLSQAEVYARIEPVLSASRVDQLTATGIGTGLMLDGFVDGQLLQAKVEDLGIGVALSAGRCGARWCLESNLLWRYRTDWDVTAPLPSAQSVVNVFSNVSSLSLVFAPKYRLYGGKRRSVFLLGGVGLVGHRVDAEYIQRAGPLGAETVSRRRRTSFEPAFLGGLQFERTFGRGWLLGAGLYYHRLGSLKIDDHPGNPAARLSARFSTLEFGVSLGRRSAMK